MGRGIQTDRYFVFDSSWHNDISNLTLRLNILMEVRLHVGKPLLNAALDVSTPIGDIAEDCVVETLFSVIRHSDKGVRIHTPPG
jgi:hypothetical protein